MPSVKLIAASSAPQCILQGEKQNKQKGQKGPFLPFLPLLPLLLPLLLETVGHAFVKDRPARTTLQNCWSLGIARRPNPLIIINIRVSAPYPILNNREGCMRFRRKGKVKRLANQSFNYSAFAMATLIPTAGLLFPNLLKFLMRGEDLLSL